MLAVQSQADVKVLPTGECGLVFAALDNALADEYTATST